MTQSERLNYLLDAFRADSEGYQNLEVPEDPAQKRRVLRSLMNIRLPGPMEDMVLAVQDDYLKESARERGIVTLDEIPTVRESLGNTTPLGDILSLWQGDITRLAVGAVVNAANSQMLGCFIPMHTCIDNCIHTFAGVQLRLECDRQMTELRRLHGPDYEQPTAVPMLTPGYNLPAEHVIHIVGPIVSHRVTPDLERDLADCYRRTLDLCAENGIKSVAFCCISTGVFRFPNDRAAKIAVDTVGGWLEEHRGQMERVIFNVFLEKDRQLYEDLLR